jgi:rhamnopyranosyl-N-acetylglucosaminyl-diphospho-decaprenol beta-1,3/1,4-galactofuranosyltransferase
MEDGCEMKLCFPPLSTPNCYCWEMHTNQVKVAAVLVAFDRDDFLKRSLEHTINQTRKCDLVIVVDNANLASTKKIIEDAGAIYISGALENGSAGGFALGITYALVHNYNYVWTLDDDGYPDKRCLELLLEFTILHNLDVSSPLSLSQEDPSQTANPYLFGIRKITSVVAIQRKQIWLGKVQFYNGMLMSKKMIELIGLPKKVLFLRGDEMDFYYRAKKTGLKMGLVTRALFHHPSGAPEFANSRTSILGVVVPTTDKKKYYQFRNRGYLIREYHLYINGFYDWIRYPVFFLLYPGGNLSGFREWRKLWVQGFRGKLTPFEAK